MGLAKVFEAIASQMPAEYAHTFDGSVSGLDRLKSESPRVLCVDYDGIKETFAGPRGAGVAGVSRAIATRLCSVPFVLWGEDADDCEVFLNHFIEALCSAGISGNYQLQDGAWKTGGVVTAGAVYVVTIAFQVPVTRSPETTTTPDAQPQTTDFVEPDQL